LCNLEFDSPTVLAGFSCVLHLFTLSDYSIGAQSGFTRRLVIEIFSFGGHRSVSFFFLEVFRLFWSSCGICCFLFSFLDLVNVKFIQFSSSGERIKGKGKNISIRVSHRLEN
jgi:hypothetical protein